MTFPPVSAVVCRALVRHAYAGLSDGDLLDRFTRQQDSQAFTELVERYAPLVWGACRRVLGGDSHAEDAFQATFIALARQARALRRPERLPGWLYNVARRIAWRHRAATRLVVVEMVPDLPSATPSPADEASGRELVAAVEAEVARLPEKYRSAVLLCWFEDASLDEAARQLGTTRATLWGRLKRARERLRRRLAARGYGLPAVLGAAALTGIPASARVIGRTVEAAVRGHPDAGAAAALAATSWALPIKSVGVLAMAAAVLVGVVTLLPAGGREPPKDAPGKDPEAKAEVAAEIADGFPLPAGALCRFGNRQLRHPDGIDAAAVSPDGKLLVTASHTAVVVWDLKTLAARRTFSGDNFSMYGGLARGGHVSFLPDSASLLYTVSPPYRPGVPIEGLQDLAQVWDIESGKMKFALKAQWSNDASAWVTGGGKEIALMMNAGNESEIHFFDVKDGKELRTVRGVHHFSTPWIGPDGNTIAYQGPNGVGLGVSDVQTGKEIYTVPDGKVAVAALSADGKLVVWADFDGKVRAHDIDAKKEILAFDHPEKQRPGPMVVSPDRQTLYFSSHHGRLFRWDLKANKKGPDFGNRHNFWHISSIVLSPDETTLYSVSYDHRVKRWDLKTGKELPLPEGYTTRTTLVAAADGKHLIVSDHEGQVDFWDLATGRRVKQIQRSHLGGINCLAQSADGRWLAGGRTSQDVRLFDLSTDKVVRDMYLADNSDSTKYGDQVQRVAFDQSGKVLFSSSEKTGVTAWEIPSGKKLWTRPGVGPYMARDPKGRWVAAGGGLGDGPIYWKLLDAKAGGVVAQAEVEPTELVGMRADYAYPPNLTDLAFLPDGSRLLTAHYDGTVRVWDPDTRREAARLKAQSLGGPAFLACSANGKWVAVGGWDRAVSVWELATGKQAIKFDGHLAGVTQVEFTRDGRGLISSADLAPVLWDLCPKDLPALDGPADALWDVLGGEDAAKTYRLQWALARHAKAAVKLLAERVDPADQALERAKFDKLTGDLDSPRFAVREKAEKELIAAGYRVPVVWLRTALAETKSDEFRARLGRVLATREKPVADERRLSRAVQALELSGSNEAKELLRAWSKAPAGSLLAVEAKGALERLDR
ncbi:MAG TPA: sigma-70 family RNA polymerase sigma factor [Gemmataceae bacterium]|nr:sigma-70 family RNA polymerase sigma factor [Gemmataceae bacterium]